MQKSHTWWHWLLTHPRRHARLPYAVELLDGPAGLAAWGSWGVGEDPRLGYWQVVEAGGGRRCPQAEVVPGDGSWGGHRHTQAGAVPEPAPVSTNAAKQVQQHCVPTQPDKHAPQPYFAARSTNTAKQASQTAHPAAWWTNSAKQTSQTAPPCHTDCPLSQRNIPSSRVTHNS